jgi:uncharacterized membrane protein (DUF106 family)
MSAPEWLMIAPVVTVAIMAVTFVMSLILQASHRLVVGHFLGWDNYRAMQKELADHRKESMDAARSNDKQRLEKVKKKQAQINALNAKMFKPQMIQMVSSFCIFPLYFFIRNFFAAASITVYGELVEGSVAVIPGVGPVSYMIWYFISALFMGIISSRIMGTTPVMT